jgi:hypothetical protein
MSAFWVVLMALSVFAAFMTFRRLGAAPVAAAVPVAAKRKAPPPRPSLDFRAHGPAPAIAKAPAPSTADASFEWDAPVVVVGSTAQAGASPASVEPVAQRTAQRERIRDRYLAARFPGVARKGADLQRAEGMIHAARLYFEDRKHDRAIELLDLAVLQSPGEESLALARLEIAFLMRDAPLYVALAGAFRTGHASTAHWDEVCRLGRAIAPEEALFGSAQGPRASDHYGPWPDMPNWIHAPWDLTAEVRATEFHQAMGRRAT